MKKIKKWKYMSNGLNENVSLSQRREIMYLASQI